MITLMFNFFGFKEGAPHEEVLLVDTLGRIRDVLQRAFSISMPQEGAAQR